MDKGLICEICAICGGYMSLDNVTIILANTKYPGNIGSAARAMFNMGLNRLVLAAPQCEINEESYRMAKGGRSVLESAKICKSVKSAVKGIRFLAGTTSKSGGYRRQAYSPEALVPRILAHAAQQKTGILFGPEDTGLVDQDLLLCQMLIRIPTQHRGHSINLAQSVMVICYELLLGSLEREPARAVRLASLEQVEAMYTQLEKALLEIGFLQPQNADHMMFTIRRMLGRAGLEPSDVGVLRGIARQIAWYAKSRQQD